MSEGLTPSQRARRAALIRHSKGDPVQATAAGRRAFLERFEKQVDPEGVLDPIERERRAERLKRAYFIDLAAKSVASRKKRAERMRRPNGR